MIFRAVWGIQAAAGLLLAFLALPSAHAEDYALPAAPAVSTATTHLDFQADHLDYVSTTSVIHLKGNAVIQESSWTIKSDELWLNTQTHIGKSSGFLLINDGVTAASGNPGEFDFDQHSGTLYQSNWGSGDWRIYSQRGVIGDNHILEYYNADVTSCDLYPDPHYHLHTTRVKVIPDHYFLGHNCVFYLHQVPLFYMPLCYKSLKPDDGLSLFQWRTQEGFDKRNGYFLDNTITSHWTHTFYSKLDLDYYTQESVGTGLELEDHTGKARGMFYGYQIQDKTTGQERWELLGDRTQPVTDHISFQGRLQALSDPNFNNDYARANVYPVTSELVNSGAFTYNGGQYTSHLSYSRDDEANATNTGFYKDAESYPRLDIQSTSLKLWKLPWLNTFSGFQDNTFAAGQGFIQHSLGAGWQATQSVPIMRGITFKPSFAYNPVFYNDYVSPVATTPVTNAFVGHYTASGDLRFNTVAGALDLTQSVTIRQRPGMLETETAANDYGIEQNLLSVEQTFRPSRLVLARFQSGYSFQQFRNTTLNGDQRIQPITGDLVFTPRTFVNLSLHDQYIYGTGNQSFIVNGQWGDVAGIYVSPGAGYNYQDSDQYFVNTDFGWVSSSGTWHFICSLRSEFHSPGGPVDSNRFGLFDKEITIIKNWHDFITKLAAMDRAGGVETVKFTVTLRLGHTPEAVAASARENYWESEWFPERAKGLE